MKAMVLDACAPIETGPLQLRELPAPVPGPGQVLLRVRACGVCHTDLHIIEGELPAHKLPLVPGHQIVGVVKEVGPGVSQWRPGDRVGVPWLNRTCGQCFFCRRGQENLCENGVFTGYDLDGGLAEFTVQDADWIYPLPDGFSDEKAAPLLCAGVIGYRALRLAGAEAGGRLGLFGFGASAHIALQVARYWGAEVYVFTRGEAHRELARELGAAWVGGVEEEAPGLLDCAVIFAPAGRLVPESLRFLRKGGTVALAGIYMTAIPEFDYRLLYHERVVRSVANSTRDDCRELLALAPRIPIQTQIMEFPLAETNTALAGLKQGRLRGAGVVRME